MKPFHSTPACVAELPADAADWCRATTLQERLVRLRAAGGGTTESTTRRDEDHVDAWRIDVWRAQSPFDDDAHFARLLATEAMSQDEFVRILTEPPQTIRRRLTRLPSWLLHLQRSFSTECELPPIDWTPDVPRSLAGCLRVAEPLLYAARQQLRTDLRRLAGRFAVVPFALGTIEASLLQGLSTEIVHLVARTLILELRVAGLRGRLDGETPADRFTSFVESLGDRQVSYSILRRYPVLGRLLVTRIRYWCSFVIEVMGHLCGDWEEIRARFAPNSDPGELVAVSGRLGDSHRKGRAVLSLAFSSGLRLVYKPRSLALDVHFAQLVESLDRMGWQPSFWMPRVIDRGDHGWVEFVELTPCKSRDELRRFYERLGGYLALLYALHATDMHSDNVIACAEHPVLVDLEALLQPSTPAPDPQSAAQRAARSLASSVLRVGFLPFMSWANDDAPGVDVSALGGGSGDMSQLDAPRFVGLGTDELRIARGPVRMPERANRPSLDGRHVDFQDHREHVEAGFARMYDVLLRSRDWLLSRGGPLEAFGADAVRVLFRETRTYGVLLYEARHPDMLQDSLDREMLLSRLWAEVPAQPDLVRLISSEREDLDGEDVPRFTTTPDSRGVWTSSGRFIPDVFVEPSLGGVRRKVRELGHADLDRQRWFIRASMATRPSGDLHRARKMRDREDGDLPPELDRARLLRGARAIGDRLEALAVRGKDDAAWLGLAPKPQGSSVVVLGVDLYDGTAGICLFLASLAAVTHDDRYGALAQAAARTVERQLDQERSRLRSIGGFSGWGGIIYALTGLATLLRLPRLLRTAEAIAIEEVPGLISCDRHYDIIGGSAGCIAGLLALHQVTRSPPLLEVASRCGDHLVRHARRFDEGSGWINPALGSKAFTGFSHGAAGVAWALQRLARHVRDDRLEHTAREAIRYERSLFLPERRNWPDLRDVGDGEAHRPSRCMTAWCHGAPGIGLGRLDALRPGEDETRSEVDVAISTTIANGFGGSHSLCHGDFGNLELLASAARELSDPVAAAAVPRLATHALDDIEAAGWQCGTPYGIECPGLMTGLAGIGFGMLRLAQPDIVPSVLLLSPPADPKAYKADPVIQNA